MTCTIIDLATRTTATAFDRGHQLLAQSSNRSQEILAERGLALRLTGRQHWTLASDQGVVARMFKGPDGWLLATAPGAQSLVDAALDAVIEGAAPQSATA